MKKIRFKTSYWKVGNHTLFVLRESDDSKIVPFVVLFWESIMSLSIHYNYQCESNTYKNEDAEPISRTDFFKLLNEVETLFKVDINVKLQ